MANNKYSVEDLFDMSKAVWHDGDVVPVKNDHAYIVVAEGVEEPFIAMYADGWFVSSKVIRYCEWPK